MKALILMGGEGKRFNAKKPKQFVNLSGKKVYLHTVEAFLSFEEFEEILLICHPDWMHHVKKEADFPRVRVIEGGLTRQDSTQRGLLACGNSTDFVVIHDAVRPFVSKEIISQNIQAVQKYQAVNTCIPSTDTIVHAKSMNTITSIPKRSAYLRGQTPQSFSYPLILEAHKQACDQNASDDCSLVLKLNHPIHIIPGSSNNIKITHELDLFLAEQLMHMHQSSLSENPTSLHGKTYAITGGTGGIGSALTSYLKEKGAQPLILSKSSSDYPVDLTHFEKVAQTFQKIDQTYGPLDGLINCVGHLAVKPFNTLSSNEIDHLIQSNFHSLLYSCRCAKIKKGGQIINLSSSSFSRGRKEYTIYSATKAAIVNFTQGLAEECPELLINVLVPQRTNTPMRRNNFPKEDPTTLLSSQEVAQKIIKMLQFNQTTGTIVEIRKL